MLAEIESCYARNRSLKEMQAVIIDSVSNKYLKLSRTSAYTEDLDSERRKDHIGHFVLRLAFCRSYVLHIVVTQSPLISVVACLLDDREDLRRRFVKAEMTLFKLRYETDDSTEKAAFLSSRNFDWIQVRQALL